MGVYNAVQKLLYLGVLFAGLVVVLSGLAIWKPVQLWFFCNLFGGYFTARYVHFFAMAAIAGFFAIHLPAGRAGAESAAADDHRRQA